VFQPIASQAIQLQDKYFQLMPLSSRFQTT
jgi:hypothetical protein